MAGLETDSVVHVGNGVFSLLAGCSCWVFLGPSFCGVYVEDRHPFSMTRVEKFASRLGFVFALLSKMRLKI